MHPARVDKQLSSSGIGLNVISAWRVVRKIKVPNGWMTKNRNSAAGQVERGVLTTNDKGFWMNSFLLASLMKSSHNLGVGSGTTSSVDGEKFRNLRFFRWWWWGV
jgi:hypothetical protein